MLLDFSVHSQSHFLRIKQQIQHRSLGPLEWTIIFRHRVRQGLKFTESTRELLRAMLQDIECVLRIVKGLDVVGGKACIEQGGGPR